MVRMYLFLLKKILDKKYHRNFSVMRFACENIQYFLIGLDHYVIQYHQCIANVFDFG